MANDPNASGGSAKAGQGAITNLPGSAGTRPTRPRSMACTSGFAISSWPLGLIAAAKIGSANMKSSWQVENLLLQGGYDESLLTLPDPKAAIHGKE